MSQAIETSAPRADAVQSDTHELHGDLAKMASDLAKVAMGVGKVKAGDKAQIKPGFSYDYASLPSVVDALKPTLSSLDIGLIQLPLVTPKGAGCTTHVLGQGWRITCTVVFSMGQSSPQAIGSMQTYARRYSLLGIFALAPGDDDGKMAEDAYQQQRGQQMQRQDQQNGRGPGSPDAKAIIGAFAKHGVPEIALVAQLEGTPIGKVTDPQLRDLRTLLQRLKADEAIEDVFGAAAMEEIINGSALGERRRTIETKAKVHADAQQSTAFADEPQEGDGYD